MHAHTYTQQGSRITSFFWKLCDTKSSVRCLRSVLLDIFPQIPPLPHPLLPHTYVSSLNKTPGGAVPPVLSLVLFQGIFRSRSQFAFCLCFIFDRHVPFLFSVCFVSPAVSDWLAGSCRFGLAAGTDTRVFEKTAVALTRKGVVINGHISRQPAAS